MTGCADTAYSGLCGRIAGLVITALVLLFPAPAAGQTIVRLAEGVEVAERASNPAQLYGTNGAALHMNTGALLGLRDIQMGWWDPAVPSLVNGDIGAGSAEHPGILNLGADVSRQVRLQADGRTVLETRPTGVDVYGSLRVCDPGCAHPRTVALGGLRARLVRLERRVARLRSVLRRVLDGRP